EYEARRLEATRAQARAGYQELLGNLGSSNTVLRVGAIKQIGSVITHDIPLEDGGGLGRNLGYFVGLVRPSVGNPYHDDLLRASALLVGAPRSPGVDGRLESESIVEMLCDIGAEGWYQGRRRTTEVDVSECLAWIWRNAPSPRTSSRPAYSLFNQATL